jgi:hypothetical protein
MEEFRIKGHFEQNAPREGSNVCCTFHLFDFVEKVFSRFEVIGFFERGNI